MVPYAARVRWSPNVVSFTIDTRENVPSDVGIVCILRLLIEVSPRVAANRTHPPPLFRLHELSALSRRDTYAAQTR